jgi:LysM repeat protein
MNVLLSSLLIFVFNLLPNSTADHFMLLRSQQPSLCAKHYTIQWGDSLSSVAQRCEMSLAELLAANPSIRNPDQILVGQVIRIPTGQSNSGSSQRADTRVEDNPIPVSGDHEYVVRTGDTLGGIAARFSTTVTQLLRANSFLVNPDQIYPGQQLSLPAAGEEISVEQWQAERISQALESQQNSGIGYKARENSERWIQVDLATQTLHAFEGDQLVRSFVVSTGTTRYPTVTGQYEIWIKLRTDDMKGPGYYLKDVPYVMYFYKGYGLHGTFWHNNFGTPMSHGCVNLAVEDAAWLFEFASIGTVVNVK